MKQRKPNPIARRAFLKGAAAAGAGAVAGAAATAAAARMPETPAASDEPRNRNYRETAHIRAYYQAARF